MSSDTQAVSEQAVTEALAAARISANRWAVKGEGLDAPELAFGWALLQAFPRFGGPPDRQWIQATAATYGVEPEATLDRLAERDLIHRDRATGAITSAYPFSGSPTPHRVEVRGGRPVYAMCAVDALGIPFMVGQDATVVSEDAATGEPVRVEIAAGQARWDPPTAVVFVPASAADGPAALTRCPHVNFFRSPAAVDGYLGAHPGLQGHVLTLDEAVAAGRRVFGTADAASTEACGETGAARERCC